MLQPQIIANLSAAQICGGTATRTDLNAAAKNMPTVFQGIMRDGMSINQLNATNSAKGLISGSPEQKAIFALNGQAAGIIRENVMETLREKSPAALPEANADEAAESGNTQFIFSAPNGQENEAASAADIAKAGNKQALTDKILQLSAEIISILEGKTEYTVDKANSADMKAAALANIIGASANAAEAKPAAQTANAEAATQPAAATEAETAPQTATARMEGPPSAEGFKAFAAGLMAADKAAAEQAAAEQAAADITANAKAEATRAAISEPQGAAEARQAGSAPQTQAAAEAMQADSAKAAISGEGHVNKQLAPLIAQLNEAIEQLGLPEEFRLQKLQESAAARMPIGQMNAENPGETQNIIKQIGSIRQHLCPSENGNEQPQTAAEPAELNLKGEQEGGEKVENRRATQQTASETAATNSSFADTVAAKRIISGERPATASAPSQPVTQENLFKTMADKISSVSGDSEQMEIQLTPDKLGKVKLNLVMSEKGISAQITADNQEVRNLLAANADRLSETLSERGLKIANIDIIYADLSGQGFKRPQSGKQNQGQRENGKTQPISTDSISALFNQDFPANIEDAFVPGFSESSVEYRA